MDDSPVDWQEQDEFDLEEEQNETNEYDRFVLEELN